VAWSYKNAENPVVGWLVAIKGPAKGASYAVRSGINHIGSGHNEQISIPEDPQIHSQHATISYDYLVYANRYDASAFYLSMHPNAWQNPVRVKFQDEGDWQMVTQPVPLVRSVRRDRGGGDAYDEDIAITADEFPIIWMGSTELMFVPFCGSRFYWKMEDTPRRGE
jgi:hypothetical protein